MYPLHFVVFISLHYIGFWKCRKNCLTIFCSRERESLVSEKWQENNMTGYLGREKGDDDDNYDKAEEMNSRDRVYAAAATLCISK